MGGWCARASSGGTVGVERCVIESNAGKEKTVACATDGAG